MGGASVVTRGIPAAWHSSNCRPRPSRWLGAERTRRHARRACDCQPVGVAARRSTVASELTLQRTEQELELGGRPHRLDHQVHPFAPRALRLTRPDGSRGASPAIDEDEALTTSSLPKPKSVRVHRPGKCTASQPKPNRLRQSRDIIKAKFGWADDHDRQPAANRARGSSHSQLAYHRDIDAQRIGRWPSGRSDRVVR